MQINKFRNIILCADDYGMSVPINNGILKLLELNRLSAVSCMTNYESWAEYAKYLKNYNNKNISIGLHFNLKKSLINILLESFKSGLLFSKYNNKFINLVKTELTNQFKKFVSEMGFVPTHLDGHQHIHNLPVIRDIIINFCKANMPNCKLRVTVTPQKCFKARVINLLSRDFANKEYVKNNKLNSNLLGIYNFSSSASYANYFKSFLNKANQANRDDQSSLVMCHPGEYIQEEQFRKDELDFFMSDQYLDIINTV